MEDQSVVSEEINGTTPIPDSKLNQLVADLRSKFLDISATSPEDYDPIDVENIKTNDFQIKRFLSYNNLNANKAFDQLVDAFKWKKSFGVKRDFSEFGIEIFQCGSLFIFGKDREGRPIFYARTKTHQRIAAFERIFKDIIVALLESLDQLSGEKGYTVVMDCAGLGLSNVDMKLTTFLITTMQKYYPETMKCLLIVNLPSIIKPVMHIIRLLLGSKYSSMMHMISHQEIFKFIDPDQVPKFLGGNSSYDFTQPPKECTKKLEEFGKTYDISPKTMRKSLKRFESLTIEAKSLVKMT